MAQLIKTADGGMWLLGKRGPIHINPAPVAPEPVAEPEPEPAKPPKPKHKTYKLHYTKPWTGRYGKFLQTFGNKNIPHTPNHPIAQGTTTEQLGNLILIYNPEGRSYWVYTEQPDENLYVATLAFSGQLKPANLASFNDVRLVYTHLQTKVHEKIAAKQSIPLAKLFGEPEPEPIPEPPEPTPEPKHRGCATPGCDWCSKPKKSVAVTKPVPSGQRCAICNTKYHTWEKCPLVPPETFALPRNSWTKDFCIRCGSLEHAEAECDWTPPPVCGSCGQSNHSADECTHGEQRATMGSRGTAPWQKRGHHFLFASDYREGRTKDRQYSVEQLWVIENEEWDPVRANADLVTLDMVASNPWARGFEHDPDMRMIVDEGRTRLRALLGYIEPRLRDYCDMVVGGELRHHKAVGGTALPVYHRPQAWKAWKEIRRVLGSDALLDAVVLFEDFTKASYGGPKWAAAAKLLWMRETEKINALVFCDKVFDMQHNGGSLLNKVSWKNECGFDLGFIQTWLGPARARKDIDWPVVMAFGSEPANRLFREYWHQANRLSRFSEHVPEPVPRAAMVWGNHYRHGGFRKSPVLNKYPHWKESVHGYCAICGKDNHDGRSKWMCEMPGCATTQIPPDGYSLHFCTGHGHRCQRCSRWMCPEHKDDEYCKPCQKHF